MTSFTTDDLARSLVRALTTDGLLMVAADVLNELHRRNGEVDIVKDAIHTHHAEITVKDGNFRAVYWSDGGPEAAMASLTPSAQIDRALVLAEQVYRKALDAPVGNKDLTPLLNELRGESE